MKLFSVGKIPTVLDTIAHKLEKRKGGNESKVIELTCRVQPFSAQQALAIDEIVKGALFRRTTGEPASYIKGLEFTLPIERQQVMVFSTPDTDKPSILFDQVKVSGLKAKVEKGTTGYVFSFRLTFGPVSKNELEFLEHWRTDLRYLSYDEAEPSLDYADVVDDEKDEDAEPAQPALGMATEPARRIPRRKTNGSGERAGA